MTLVKLFFIPLLSISVFAQVNIQGALILKLQKVTKPVTANQLQPTFELLREATKLPQNEALVYEALRITLLTFANDPNRTAIIILLDQYESNKKLYHRVIKKFEFQEASLLFEAFDIRLRESIEGNG